MEEILDETATFLRPTTAKRKSKITTRRKNGARYATKNHPSRLSNKRSKLTDKSAGRNSTNKKHMIQAWESCEKDSQIEEKMELVNEEGNISENGEALEREVSSPSGSSSDGISVMSLPGEENNEGCTTQNELAALQINIDINNDKERSIKTPVRAKRMTETGSQVQFRVNGVSSTLNSRAKSCSYVPRKGFEPMWKLDKMFLVSSDFSERSLDLLSDEPRQQRLKSSSPTNSKQKKHDLSLSTENLPTLAGKSYSMIPRKARTDSPPCESRDNETKFTARSAPSSARAPSYIDVNNMPAFKQPAYKPGHNPGSESGSTADERSPQTCSRMNSHRNNIPSVTVSSNETQNKTVSSNSGFQGTITDKTIRVTSPTSYRDKIPNKCRSSNADLRIEDLCIRNENSRGSSPTPSSAQYKAPTGTPYHNGPKELMLRQASNEYLSARLMCELDSVLNTSVTNKTNREAKVSPSITRKQSLANGKFQIDEMVSNQSNEQIPQKTGVHFVNRIPEQKRIEHNRSTTAKSRPRTSRLRTEPLADMKLQKRAFVTFDDVAARVRPVSLRNPADPMADRCRKIDYQLKNIEFKELKKGQRQKEKLLKQWIKETNTQNDVNDS